MKKKVHWVRGWRFVLLWPVIKIVQLWTASLQLKLETPGLKIISHSQEPLIFIIWHNRLFFAGEIFKRIFRHRKVSGLVSASKDGAWLCAVFKLFGIQSIRGSSSYRGAQALKEVILHMKKGYDFAITPDGPRGPRYSIAPGCLHIAQSTQAPIVLISWHYHKAWKLNSWDQFLIPKPFSKVTVRYEYIPSFQSINSNSSTIALFIQEKLHALAPIV